MIDFSLSQQLIGRAIKSQSKGGAGIEGMATVEVNAGLVEFWIDRIDEPTNLGGKQGLTERRGNKLHHPKARFIDHVLALPDDGILQHRFRSIAVEHRAAGGREKVGCVCVE